MGVTSGPEVSPPPSRRDTAGRMTIGVDLRSVLPGGENGGAKVLVLTLLRGLVAEAPELRWRLFTAPWNHDELLEFEGPAVTCALEPDRPTGATPRASCGHGDRHGGDHGIDLMFYPFTTQHVAIPGAPVVAIAYDLLHRDLPQFIDSTERERRDRDWTALLERANVIACISEFTRSSISRHFPGVAGDRMVVVYPAVHKRPSDLTPASDWRPSRPYALYPANFWPHKNHARLLDGYVIYRATVGEAGVDLVLTGAMVEGQRRLRERVCELGLADVVHLPGYVNDRTMSAIWRAAHCVIYPSVYEGFGIPLVEAMEFEVPVAASSAGSLPEIGADAARYFDPDDPAGIALALEAIAHDQSLRRRLVSAGRERRNAFSFEAMTAGFLRCFETTLREGARAKPAGP